MRTHVPQLNPWINPRVVHVGTHTSRINLIQARGQHSSLFLLNLPRGWSLCCLYPYADLLLAARKQPVSASIKLGVEDTPSHFWNQCEPSGSICNTNVAEVYLIAQEEHWDCTYCLTEPQAQKCALNARRLLYEAVLLQSLLLDLSHFACNACIFPESGSTSVTL